MNDIKTQNESFKEEIDRLNSEKADLNSRLTDFGNMLVETGKAKDERIANLERQLRTIKGDLDKRLNRSKTKREEIQQKLNIEEKERELFGVKHDQLVINIRKLMLQKKFLEKQLDKDSSEVQLEMNKI